MNKNRSRMLPKKAKTVVYDHSIYKVVFSGRKLLKDPDNEAERGKIMKALLTLPERRRVC